MLVASRIATILEKHRIVLETLRLRSCQIALALLGRHVRDEALPCLEVVLHRRTLELLIPIGKLWFSRRLS